MLSPERVARGEKDVPTALEPMVASPPCAAAARRSLRLQHRSRKDAALHAWGVRLLTGAALLALVGCGRGRDADAPVATPPAPTESATETEGDVAADEGAAAAPAPTESAGLGERGWSAEEIEALRARLGLAPQPALVIDHLLTTVDVREILQQAGGLRVLPLQGQRPAPGYNAFHIAPEQGFGVALQAWRADELRLVEARYERLRETYIQAERLTGALGDRAFHGAFGGVRHVVWLHRPSRQVLSLTCAEALCDPSQLQRLAERVNTRL